MKDHLIFDTTNATTKADSDNVGAYIRAADGTLITHSNVGGKDALDVHVVDGINVEVDLSYVDDSVTAHQGGTWTIDSITNDVTVIASDLDIRDLSATQDSVESWLHDGAGTALTSTLVSGKQALDVNIVNSLTVNDAALAATAIASAAETLDVASTAQNVVASPLASRKYLFIYNNDNQKMFIGGTGVTAANGFPVSPGSYVELRAGAAVDIEFVSSKLNHEIRTLELS